jgi:hypothetical protein
MNNNAVIQDVEVLELIRLISKRNKRLQAKLLQELELHFPKDSQEYQEFRKFILDELNGYTRYIVKELFGDIEILIR